MAKLAVYDDEMYVIFGKSVKDAPKHYDVVEVPEGFDRKYLAALSRFEEVSDQLNKMVSEQLPDRDARFLK